MTQDMEITEDDLLTWELQLSREGTLPPEAQRLLLAHVRGLEADLAMAEDRHEAALDEEERINGDEIERLEGRISDLLDEVQDLKGEIAGLKNRIAKFYDTGTSSFLK